MSNFFYTADGRKITMENFGDVPTTGATSTPVASPLAIATSVSSSTPDDSLRLKGNLSLDGSVRASKFILEDGSEMKTILQEKKMVALPENVAFDAQGNMIIGGGLKSKGVAVDGPFSSKAITVDGPITSKGLVIDGNINSKGINVEGQILSSKGMIVDGTDNVNKYSLDKNGVNTIGSQGGWTVFKQHSSQGWKFNNENNETVGAMSAKTGDMEMKGRLTAGALLSNSTTGSTVVATGNDKGMIQGPNGTLRMNAQGIMFGGPNKGTETNSAQITAGLHMPDSLNIVGMSRGADSNTRRIDMWAEGGMNLHGNINVDAGRSLCVGKSCVDEAKLSQLGNASNVKRIVVEDRMVMMDKPIYLRGPDDSNHQVVFEGKVDGPRLTGFQGGVLGTSNGGLRDKLRWDVDNVHVNGQLNVNGNLNLNGAKFNPMADTRAKRLLPTDYRKSYGVGEVTEFKENYDGVPGFSYVKTLVPWPDTSGGRVKQIAYADNGVFYRVGTQNDSAWEAWRKMD